MRRPFLSVQNMRIRTLIVLLGLALAVRLFSVYAAPVFLCADEAAHFTYAKWIQSTGDLPSASWSMGITEGEIPGTDVFRGVYTFENYQNPAYYILSAGLLIFSHSELYAKQGERYSAPITKDGQVRLVRWFSLLLVMTGACLLAWVARDQLSIVAFLLLPGVVVITSMVTNQALEFAAACGLCVGLVRKDWRVIAGCLLLMAVAKVTGVVVAAAFLVYWVATDWRRAWMALPALGIGGLATMHRLGLSTVNAMNWWAVDVATVWDRIVETVVTGAIHPLIKINNFGYVSSLMAVACLAVVAPWLWRMLRRAPLSVYAVGAYAIMSTWVVFSLCHDFTQGRLLYAAVPFLIVNGGGVVAQQGGSTNETLH